MSTKIKLMRRGKTRQPYYRIVVADSRTKRDGRSIEEIGKYHPKEDPSYMEVDAERVAYWLSVGAQPTEAVRAILRVTGDWQKFHGEPAPEPMKVKAAKPDRRAAFEAATQLGGSEPDTAATTPKKKAAKADVQVERADKTDVEVDVEAQSPRAGVRQTGAKAGDKSGDKAGDKAGATADAKAESATDAKAESATDATSDGDHAGSEPTEDTQDLKTESGRGIVAAVAGVVEKVVEKASEVAADVVDKASAKGDDKAAPAKSASKGTSPAKGTESSKGSEA